MIDLSLFPHREVRHIWATLPAIPAVSAEVSKEAPGLSGPQPESPGRRPEPGLLEGLRQRRVTAGPFPVGAFHGQPPERAVPDGAGQRNRAEGQPPGIVGPGQQGTAAALDVQDQRSVHEHDQRAGLAAGPVRGSRLAAALGPALRGRRGKHEGPFGRMPLLGGTTHADRPGVG